MNQTSTTGSPASKFPGSPHSGIGLQSPLPPMHSVWDHWVDSRTPNPAKDEGDLWPQPSGSILEKGEMINPHTGKLTEYEELWADEEPQATGYDCQRVSAVLVMECESNAGAPGTRGMVIRVGQWCQGIMVGGGEAENGGGRAVDIERWTWVPSALEPAVAPDGEGGTEGSREPEREEAKRDGDWERIAKIGSRFLPCSLLFDAGEAGNVEEGNVVEAGEATWKVVEKYLW
ncbi:MAG: hypothetical protein M1837_003115 [Sclerophora amabilis]|nr:MAG: hypothetical protein M1837_003115 [Sclerophora amabilis]